MPTTKGPEYFSRLGSLGGEATRRKGGNHYHNLGRQGGEATAAKLALDPEFKKAFGDKVRAGMRRVGAALPQSPLQEEAKDGSDSPG